MLERLKRLQPHRSPETKQTHPVPDWLVDNHAMINHAWPRLVANQLHPANISQRDFAGATNFWGFPPAEPAASFTRRRPTLVARDTSGANGFPVSKTGCVA